MILTPFQWLVVFTVMVFATFAFSYRFRRTGPGSLRKRLRTIVIPELTLENATISEALELLGKVAERNDPQGMGVPFVTSTRTDETVSVTMERQSLWDALEGISLLFSVYYHIDDARNTIESYLPPGDDDPLTRRYTPSGDNFPKPWTIDFEADFRDIGLELRNDGYARYEDRVLTVRAPENTLNLIEKMFGLDPLSTER